MAHHFSGRRAWLVGGRSRSEEAHFMMARRSTLLIKNQAEGRARWPDWFVRMICEWIYQQTGLADCRPRALILRPVNPGRPDYLGGVSDPLHGRIEIILHRRVSDFKPKESHRHWARILDIRCRVEFFVFLIAHEMRHWMPENTRQFPGRAQKDRWHRERAEFDADQYAQCIVDRFRREWPMIRARAIQTLREARMQEQHLRKRPMRF